jgi:hypothetical protein
MEMKDYLASAMMWDPTQDDRAVITEFLNACAQHQSHATRATTRAHTRTLARTRTRVHTHTHTHFWYLWVVLIPGGRSLLRVQTTAKQHRLFGCAHPIE